MLGIQFDRLAYENGIQPARIEGVHRKTNCADQSPLVCQLLTFPSFCRIRNSITKIARARVLYDASRGG